MTDSSHHQPIDARALHSRLAVIANTNNTSSIEHGATQGRPRPSIDSTNTRPFTKSSTISTFDSHTSSTSSRLYASPSSRLHPESVGIAPGDFSKPRVPKRSRRHTMESGTSSSSSSGRKEREEPAQFKYYGRHGNQWLFNDFSVTGAVAKGFRRVFGGHKGERDWYEDRER
ncbi:hypothetical protein GGP41_009557 [Bipolaris sorokiniana]|nr:hypothetical protein GGP41_009557 [Bipolaris sorokiniana]